MVRCLSLRCVRTCSPNTRTYDRDGRCCPRGRGENRGRPGRWQGPKESRRRRMEPPLSRRHLRLLLPQLSSASALPPPRPLPPLLRPLPRPLPLPLPPRLPRPLVSPRVLRSRCGLPAIIFFRETTHQQPSRFRSQGKDNTWEWSAHNTHRRSHAYGRSHERGRIADRCVFVHVCAALQRNHPSLCGL